MTTRQVITKLKSLKNPKNIAGMARFGIQGGKLLGIPVPVLRQMAKGLRNDHELALGLWSSGIHEARLLATMVDDPKQVTPDQMEKWVKDFDSWDVCDQACGNLFDKTPWAVEKALAWTRREREYEKRAGFVMMAELAVHDKKAANALFVSFFPVIRREAGDDRNFVKKAINWALRQIGKRNRVLNRKAIAEARTIWKQGTPSARWIAVDALRELLDPRLKKKWR
jgi:3-methyladenine DNA glycosylase AlkD